MSETSTLPTAAALQAALANPLSQRLLALLGDSVPAREIARFAQWCATRVQEHQLNPSSAAALDTAWRFVRGHATAEELAEVLRAAERDNQARMRMGLDIAERAADEAAIRVAWSLHNPHSLDGSEQAIDHAHYFAHSAAFHAAWATAQKTQPHCKLDIDAEHEAQAAELLRVLCAAREGQDPYPDSAQAAVEA